MSQESQLSPGQRPTGPAAVPPAAASPKALPAGTQRWVLALASAASFLVVLDMLVVATALTAIQRHLGSSLADLEWTVNAYTLTFAVLLMTASALGDRLGRRRVLVAGLAVFAIASGACALAPDTGALVAARAVQGAGAAAIMPSALALLNGVIPAHRRGRALGIYGSVTGLAAAAGPIIGGAVTQGLGWQWVFWVNIPIAVVSVVAVLSRVPEARGVAAAIDLRGLGLVSAAALGLVWGLVRGNAAGWGSAEVVATLAAGAAAALAFGAWQWRARSPMLPPRLFRSRAFTGGNIVIFALNGSMSAAVFEMPQFLQVAQGLHPLAAGLRLLPWGLTPMVVAPLAGRLADRVSARSLTVTGLALQAAGLAWIAAVTTTGTGYATLVAPMIVSGAGFAIAIPTATRSATSMTPPADFGRASGAFSTMRQLGGAFGIAVAGAAFAAAGSYRSPQAFTSGFTAAMTAVTVMAAAGVLAALIMPGAGPGKRVSGSAGAR